jgi:NifB/MoaA-like Fe-S oxidoreductase
MPGHDLETLKEMYDRLLAEQEKRYLQMFKYSDEALKLAAESLENRLEHMNEFRKQLNDQANTFLTKEIFEAKHLLIWQQVDDLRLSKAKLEGKASQQAVNLALFIGVFSLLASLVDIIAHLFIR